MPQTAQDLIGDGARSFDASKYIYGKAVDHASEVSQYIQTDLDAAARAIKASSNNTVRIDGGRIHVSGRDNPKLQMRIVNGMIAISDDNWETSKLAIGFFNTESGPHYAVNAEVIEGKLVHYPQPRPGGSSPLPFRPVKYILIF